MNNTNTIIKLDNVEKHYQMGESIVKALDGVDVTINKGDFVVIIGPSGSGKSTMMNMVGALDLATKGEIFLEGQDIEHLEESDLAQIRGRKIGFVFQTFNLIPTLTALGNITLPMIFQGLSDEERNIRGEKILQDVKLSHRKNHLPNELSGGERQRVAIGRALANNPEVILADEPTGNLDSKTGLEIMGLFQDLNKKGKTIILVTHDLSLVKYATKVLKIRDGKIEHETRSKK
ncbi:MAG: ABC transporter ATP-binding protein [Nanoarchaeota archaeon]|nr:ABC transporter ATP-binding protein [Nanoarchaeota archaeon]